MQGQANNPLNMSDIKLILHLTMGNRLTASPHLYYNIYAATLFWPYLESQRNAMMYLAL